LALVTTGITRTFRADEFDAATLARAKRGQRVSVCIPARDEAATVGPIVAAVVAGLVESCGLVDEVLVVDDHSVDTTAAVAAAAGATVVAAPDVLPGHADGPGKGEALWKSLFVSTGDLVVWCDADVTNFDPAFVVGLLGPLLTRPDVALVKAFYERPFEGRPGGGGRVTELVARPVLSLLFPHLAGILQPLGGEYAGRREVLEQVPFERGYGVEIGLLVDVAARFGVEAVAQVDLGVREHRNRPLDQLAVAAVAVLRAALERAPVPVPDVVTLARPTGPPVEVVGGSLPALADLPDYRRSA
jgi:glucosyl-3-phosphoglycerate synthase